MFGILNIGPMLLQIWFTVLDIWKFAVYVVFCTLYYIILYANGIVWSARWLFLGAQVSESSPSLKPISHNKCHIHFLARLST